MSKAEKLIRLTKHYIYLNKFLWNCDRYASICLKLIYVTLASFVDAKPVWTLGKFSAFSPFPDESQSLRNHLPQVVSLPPLSFCPSDLFPSAQLNKSCRKGGEQHQHGLPAAWWLWHFAGSMRWRFESSQVKQSKISEFWMSLGKAKGVSTLSFSPGMGTQCWSESPDYLHPTILDCAV